MSKDIIVLADEMYLRKCVQYSQGQYIGADEEGTAFKGIMVFMI